MSRCIDAEVADRVRHGRLPDDALIRALRHAVSCADCRHRLFAGRSDGELDAATLDEIQARLTTWRAARRAPLSPAVTWVKGREIDRYVIIRSVGGTDDGVIYEAFDTEREERVVVKQLDLRADDPSAPAMIATANRLCQLSHPNILQTLAVGVHAGFVYLVYELVKGTPLTQTGDDPAHLIALFADAARGLAAAHDVGIVHGCFSPASCVVGRDGRVRVLDFAIGEARCQRASAPRARTEDWRFAGDPVNGDDSFVGFVPSRRRPTSGEFEAIVLAAGPSSLGARIYAAPERVLGEPPSAAADQFALCAALYHRLYGAPPFDGETISLWLRALVTGPSAGRLSPPARPDVPVRVQAALLRGLAGEPAARFDRMAGLVAQLSRTRPVLGKKSLAGAIGVGAAGAVAVIALVSALRADAPAPAAADCNPALAGWDGVWSASKQAQLALGGSDAAALLGRRLDGWLAGWRGATGAFCRLPEHVSLDCATRAHAAAADLVQTVEQAPGRLARATGAADALPTADQCATSAPSPANAPAAAVKADVRRRLGLYDEADQLLAQPVDDPAQRSYRALVRGRTAVDRGELLEARRLFETAAFDAEAAHQPALGAAAALQRLALACSVAERTLWSGYYAAQTQLAGHAAPLAYRSALASSFACEGRLAEATAQRQQIAQALRGEHDTSGTAYAEAVLELARAQLAQSDLAGAESNARDAATRLAQLLGVHHPLAETARLVLAEAQLVSAQASAAATIDAVLADLPGSEPDPVRAHALLLQSRIASARGLRDDALQLAQRASQAYEAALGGAHPALADALLAEGDLLLAAGRDAEAETRYRQVAAIFDTLGHAESAKLAHARAGIQLARWGNRPPPDASELLHWGLALDGNSDGDGIDPSAAGWVADQLAQRSAAHGDQPAALAHYRAAAAAWQDSGNPLGLASALTGSALLAAQLHAADARQLLEQALQLPTTAASDKPRLQGALAKLLWPGQRDRARALARAALAELPDSSPDAAELQRWLQHHDAR